MGALVEKAPITCFQSKLHGHLRNSSASFGVSPATEEAEFREKAGGGGGEGSAAERAHRDGGVEAEGKATADCDGVGGNSLT